MDNSRSGNPVKWRAIEHYMDAGFSPIPVPAREKNPNRPGWQNERWSPEDIPHQWNNGQGVGILWGEPSGGAVDIEGDWPEARAVASYIAPKTRTFGRPGAPRSHYILRATGTIPRTKRYKLPGGGDERSVVELLSTGTQSLVPPSLHESGEQREWYDRHSVAEVEGAEVEAIVADIATAALLLKNYPGKGARHDFGNAATGYVGRNLPRERAERVMDAVIRASGDEEAPARRRTVRDTLDKLERGERTTGGPTLDQLAPGVYEQLRRWHGWGARSGGPGNYRHAGVASESGRFPLTDLGNAERLIHRHGSDLRYCHPWRRWLVWDGTRWRSDDSGEVERRAVETVRAIYAEAERAEDADDRKRIARHATASEARTRIDAMIALARSIPGVAVTPEQLDADPWRLNVANGTLDLQSGELCRHNRGDLITKIAPVAYDPEARAPRFDRFLQEVLVEDDVIAFVRRLAGYSLTGSTRERVLAILYGRGKNGKSTLVELLHDVLGDYAKNTDTETVLRKKYAGVGNDVAALKGARFVSAAEIEHGRALAEAKIKNLTGSDTVTARFLFAEPFDFRPQFKLWLSTNNKPIIKGTDDAIWDRIRLIPFTQRFDGPRGDASLPDKLRTELPGVLSWMVEGCMEWQQGGLGGAAVVSEATGEYREEMDTLAAFIEDRCVVGDKVSVPATPLYHAYRAWCDENGESPEKQRSFGMALKDREFEGFKYSSGAHKDRSGWRGIGLRAEDKPPPGSPGYGGGEQSGQNLADDHPLSGGLAEDHPLGELRIDKGKSSCSGRGAEESGSKTQKVAKKTPRVEKNVEISSASSASSAREQCKHDFTPSFCHFGCGEEQK